MLKPSLRIAQETPVGQAVRSSRLDLGDPVDHLRPVDPKISTEPSENLHFRQNESKAKAASERFDSQSIEESPHVKLRLKAIK